MKNQNGIRKTSAAAIALLAAAGTLFCSCAKTTLETEADLTASVETTAEETTEATEATETTAEATETTVADWRDTIPYEELVLDGVAENVVVTTDYCYIESEKYVLFFEKDLGIPGDFTTNIDAIIDEIEVETGLEACPSDFTRDEVSDMSIYYGFNPWDNVSIGSKIPIFFFIDHENKGLIPCACSEYAVFINYELYSDEYWTTNYDRDEDWRRDDYIDYTTIAHELTHTITGRYANMTSIMTEGVAEYMGRSVISALADEYPSIGETNEKRYLYDEGIPAPVNADNAEEVFIGDYNEISHADRGAEYVTGRYLCQFLHEKFGDGFIRDYLKISKAQNLPDIYSNYTESDAIKYANAFKSTYGEDVFTEFGDWCVENNALQNTDGVG